MCLKLFQSENKMWPCAYPVNTQCAKRRTKKNGSFQCLVPPIDLYLLREKHNVKLKIYFIKKNIKLILNILCVNISHSTGHVIYYNLINFLLIFA